MANVPYPVIHAPTRANRAAVLARLHAAGIYLGGDPKMRGPTDEWEETWGSTTHHIMYHDGHEGSAMAGIDGPLPPTLTLVNSPDHFISYVRRHKLPLAS